MRKLIFSLLLGLFLISFSSATTQLYEYYDTGDDNAAGPYGNIMTAQNFTVGNVGDNVQFTIVNISLKLYKVGSPGQFEVYLFGSDANGNPDVSDIKVWGFMNGDDLPAGAGGTWTNITMNSTSFSVSEDEDYFIGLNNTGGDAGNYVGWRHDESSPTYTGGRKTDSIDAGSTWISVDRDQMFRVWGSSPQQSVSLTSPTNGSNVNSEPVTFNSTITLENANITNATLFVWYSNGSFFKSNTTEYTGNETFNTSWTLSNFSIGDYIWNVEMWGNSTPTTLFNVSSPVNYTFSWVPFTVDGEVYNSHTYETANDTFYMNITTSSTVSNIGAFLVYNGTNYAASHTCTNGFCQIEREIDIIANDDTTVPSENNTFYWSITLFGDFGTSTTTTTNRQQNVSRLLFQNSGGGAESIIFNTYNESDRVPIDTLFDATFEYWVGDGTVTKTYNVSLSGAKSHSFDINHNLSYSVNSNIWIQNNTNIRNYYLYKEIYSNVTINQDLYIYNETETSDIIIQVKDQGLIPLEDYWVKIFRYYPEINQWLLTGASLTDEFGQFVAEMVESNEQYKFEFYDSDKVLRKTSKDLTVACKTSICVLPFIVEVENGVFDRFDGLSLFDFSLYFNNVTNIFTFSWDDQRQEDSFIRFEVTRFSLNQSTTVCNLSSTTKVSALNCDVGSTDNYYTAQVFRTVNGEEQRLITVLNVKVGGAISTYGVEGLLWVFLLLFTAFSIGVFNPSVGAILYGAGFVIMGLIGVISMPLPVFFANTIIVVIFVWAVRT